MRIAHEEVFGPVMALMSFSTEDEAICMANACRFGLGSSIFVAPGAYRNPLRHPRLRRMLTGYGTTAHEGLRVGMCNVNDFGINYLAQSMPFGGCKWSGFDRFAGEEGLKGLCRPVSTTVDRFPGVVTRIPTWLAYPVGSVGFHFCKYMADMLFHPRLMDRIRGMRGLARIALGRDDETRA